MADLITGTVYQVTQFHPPTPASNVSVSLLSADNLGSPVVVMTDQFGQFSTDQFIIPFDTTTGRYYLDLLVECTKSGFLPLSERKRVWYHNSVIGGLTLTMNRSGLVPREMYRRVFLKKMEIFDDTDLWGGGEIWLRAGLSAVGVLSAPFSTFKQPTLSKDAGPFNLSSNAVLNFTRASSPIVFTIRRPFYNQGIKIWAMVRDDDNESVGVFNPLDSFNTDDFESLMEPTSSGAITNTRRIDLVFRSDKCRLTFALALS